MSNQWNDDGSFRNKPTGGWLHQDHQLLPGNGVLYPVRYMGCLEIIQSMRSMTFETRKAVTKQCTNIVSSEAGMRSTNTKKIDKNLTSIIKDTPNMTNAGKNCQITIDTETVQLLTTENQEVIGLYPLNSISFTSSGDVDLDFVAIVSKDVIRGRFCYILECGNVSAHDILNTLGQAFELRYKQFLNFSMLENSRAVGNCYVADPSAPSPSDGEDEKESDTRPTETATEIVQTPIDDFGMEPFKPEGCIGAGDPTNEEWYHGNISRQQAEDFLQEDGDFLVRAASNCPGQYVLSGRHNHKVRHLLLVDPNGIVRTKTQAFNSISHLIRHYVTSGSPIQTQDGLFVLKKPIAQAIC